MEEETKKFFNSIGIRYDKYDELDGYLVDRDTLINKDYDKYELNIEKLNEYYKNDSITSLKKNAKESQRWPILNLTRQILKVKGFHMKPIRKANGYSKSGKKLYKRSFKLEKIDIIKNDTTKVNLEDIN